MNTLPAKIAMPPRRENAGRRMAGLSAKLCVLEISPMKPFKIWRFGKPLESKR